MRPLVLRALQNAYAPPDDVTLTDMNVTAPAGLVCRKRPRGFWPRSAVVGMKPSLWPEMSRLRDPRRSKPTTTSRRPRMRQGMIAACSSPAAHGQPSPGPEAPVVRPDLADPEALAGLAGRLLPSVRVAPRVPADRHPLWRRARPGRSQGRATPTPQRQSLAAGPLNYTPRADRPFSASLHRRCGSTIINIHRGGFNPHCRTGRRIPLGTSG